MRIIVSSTPARQVNAKDGKRHFHVQAAGLVGDDGLAQRFEVWHNSNETPYAAGEHTLDVERSVYVDQKGNLAIRPKLIPLAKPAKPA